MPPGPASKTKNGKTQARDRRSRSRATTPISASTEASAPSTAAAAAAAAAAIAAPTGESPYLHTSLASLLVPPSVSIESLIEEHGGATSVSASGSASSVSASSNNPPSASNLHQLVEGITSHVLTHVQSRIEACDKGMRELSKKRKERIEAERLHEETERLDKKRKRDKDREAQEDHKRPPAVGAHGLARQDGTDTQHKPKTEPDQEDAQQQASSPLPSTSQIAANNDASADMANSPSASATSHQPPPAPVVAHYETFGEDPTEFDDPTVYHIRELTPDMTDEEKKSILCVARYPHDDLHDLTPGTPPDMDFSNAKPPNQIGFGTFQTYVEPYIRPLTEEDVAFLKERGDRLTPYLIPPRGPLPYKELWAKEDGVSHHDFNTRYPPNDPRGSIDLMNDDVAETDKVSTGPVLSRLLETLRHDTSVSNGNDLSSQTANADVAMTNGETTAGAEEGDTSTIAPANTEEEAVASLKPATYFANTSGAAGVKLAATSTRDYAPLDQRALQELRYCGFLTPEATPDFDSHYDDELAARLRYLQSELLQIARENGARKARVLELTEERMAMQEYATIADDLDTQINTAYLKRNRTMSKPKKGAGKARPGQTGTGGLAVSRNAVSEGVRQLMDRRKEWRDLIGPVVEYGHTGIPKETVFDKTNMERLEKVEAEAGANEAD